MGFQPETALARRQDTGSHPVKETAGDFKRLVYDDHDGHLKDPPPGITDTECVKKRPDDSPSELGSAGECGPRKDVVPAEGWMTSTEGLARADNVQATSGARNKRWSGALRRAPTNVTHWELQRADTKWHVLDREQESGPTFRGGLSDAAASTSEIAMAHHKSDDRMREIWMDEPQILLEDSLVPIGSLGTDSTGKSQAIQADLPSPARQILDQLENLLAVTNEPQNTPGALSHTKTFRVTLKPDDLGSVEMRLQMRDGELAVELLAERPDTAQLLEDDLQTLNSVLQKVPVESRLSAVHVSVREMQIDRPTETLELPYRTSVDGGLGHETFDQQSGGRHREWSAADRNSDSDRRQRTAPSRIDVTTRGSRYSGLTL